MRILEHFSCGKRNDPDLCEDALMIGPQLAAVVDGATSKGGRLLHGMSSGRYASQCLARALQAESIWEMDHRQLFSFLDHCLCASWTAHDLLEKELPRASVILYNDYFHQIWGYGDCQCMINGVLHTHTKPVDILLADLRSFVLEYHLLHGTDENSFLSEDPGRKAIEPLLNMQFSFENRPGPWGYPVLNGRGICPEMIVTYTVHPGDEIVLASDGYPHLMETLEKSERALNQALKTDPLCYRDNRSTKGLSGGAVSFDDRCYCRILV